METGGADSGAGMQDVAADAEMTGESMAGEGEGYSEDASGQQLEDGGENSEEW